MPVAVPLVDPSPGASEIADRIRARRGPAGLLEIDQVMLNSEPMANGWNELLKGVRGSEAISAKVRELLILRTTFLLDAAYEYKPHVGIGEAAGLSKEQLDFTRLERVATTDELQKVYEDEELVLSYEVASASTIFVKIDDDLLVRLKKVFSAQQLVDVFTVVAAYNFTSRVVVGLDVGGASKVKAGFL
ncbi:hypothetical protein T439DRAFT_382279 [Meredithblackwellia eburnea MCA 4105]